MRLRTRVYQAVGPVGKSRLDRARYLLGQLPRVNPRCQDGDRAQAWLPSPYRAGLVISADFELAWAWRYVKSHDDPLALALAKAKQARRNLPRLLDLFDRFDLPITWAVVGHLFLDRCERVQELAHPDLERPPYFENEYWHYRRGDWFDADPGTGLEAAPAWYAPDLIRRILASKVRHEIGCHSFSHVNCQDGACPPRVMDAELAACRRLAADWGIELRSFVFPGNLAGNFESLRRAGFSAYRWHSGYELDLPVRDPFELWRIPGGLSCEIPEGWPARAWIQALQRCVDRALETETLLHFWFHPSADAVTVDVVGPAILEYVAARRDDLWFGTMGDLVELQRSAIKV